MKLTILVSLLAAATQASAGRCANKPPAASPLPPAPTEAPTSSEPAAPKPTSHPPVDNPAGAYAITLAQLNKAVPASAADSYCGGKAGCVSNKVAVDAINKALAAHKITRRSEAVAVLAWMAFESESWMYSKNMFPGNPGQGARPMMMYEFVYQYAKTLFPDKVQDSWKGLVAGTAANNQTMNSVRDMVIADEQYNFGAGFWYLAEHTKGYYNNPSALRDGNEDDFKKFCTEGINTSYTSGRSTVWSTVNAGL
ncbi:hypothetical protein H4R19_004508 [Coemansia spiralis]|nr:hypothetical protein H4R19_004508 [Coemansia spiralis]